MTKKTKRNNPADPDFVIQELRLPIDTIITLDAIVKQRVLGDNISDVCCHMLRQYLFTSRNAL